MKKAVLALFIFTIGVACSAFAGATITYTYDKQHRLVSADYSAAQVDAHVAYQYDAASNLDVYVAITDSQYLKSFLWYLSWLPSSVWHSHDFVEVAWRETWASIAAKS